MTQAHYTNYEAFEQCVGLITDPERLKGLGLPEMDSKAMFDTWHLPALYDFCQKNPQYHIVTWVDEDEEMDKLESLWNTHHPDTPFDTLTDDEIDAYREDIDFNVYTLENCMTHVNRLGYHLADGDANPDIYLTEVTHSTQG